MGVTGGAHKLIVPHWIMSFLYVSPNGPKKIDFSWSTQWRIHLQTNPINALSRHFPVLIKVRRQLKPYDSAII